MTSPTIQESCRRILEGGTLADKRAGSIDAADEEGDAVDVDVPVRSGVLLMVEGAERLPALRELHRPEARVACLSRFAHHEMMAIELFAWALLRFPAAHPALRRGLWAALVEEQTHLGLYLDRLGAHGASLGDVPLSGYFWKLVPAIRSAGDPLKAFLCTQGLTLEQANLDFTIMFRDAFALAGDVESAAVMKRVHDDEVGHVRLARTWLCKEGPNHESSDVDAYRAHVPFPLSAARAKGRRFEIGARRKAGLSEPFITHVKDARPYT
ncbi:MAG: DUF455 family protein [Deltaproteobacteria bacterium]|nr:DUF455 family protein [Deltaproteobacteria bacterium]